MLDPRGVRPTVFFNFTPFFQLTSIKMRYTNLGKSGLQVSTLCLGTMTFGNEADEATCKDLYAHARDHGINFFDCANVYVGGESERILGRLIQDHRAEVIIASKGYFPTGPQVNQRGSSRFHLTKALDDSLKRLNTDYIDLYYLHRFDPTTPLEESLSTLNDFVRQGKVLYLGLSNFAAWQVMKAKAITQQHNYETITCLQPMYNLLKRQCESEILPMAMDQGLGIVPYSPLAGGLLSGKYLTDEAIAGRFNFQNKYGEMYQQRYLNEVNTQAVKRFMAFTTERGLHPVSTAVAWVMTHPGVSSPIIGARSVAQLSPALKATEMEMTADLREAIGRLSLSPSVATDRTEEEK